MLNSNSIILWGKNPAYTAIHTASYIKKAIDKGIEVIVIDPLYTETAKKLSTKYIRVNAGGDGALALAMNKLIVEKKLYDKNYIDSYVLGFSDFKKSLDNLNLEDLLKISGVSREDLEFLVDKYSNKYSSIHIGYGVQKYNNGGNTIRAIDALGAITGQIGFSGGGINYANKVYPKVLNIDPYNSESFADNKEVEVSNLADYILNNEVKLALIYKSNLLNQFPNLNKLKKAFNKIDFKICSELFMTDTAKECDLIIPATNVFESEDLLYSSMNNPYLIYKEEVVKPKNSLMDEYYFFRELAKIMNLENYPMIEKKKYLEKVIEPLKEYDKEITLDKLKEIDFTIAKAVPWEDKIFETKSKKIELYSKDLEEIGLEPIANINIKNNKEKGYPIRLLTVHHRDSLSSQHFKDNKNICQGYINKETAELYNVKDNSIRKIKSKYGELEIQINIDDSCGLNVMKIYAGYWEKQGNPNYLTGNFNSEIGNQIAYNESFVSLE